MRFIKLSAFWAILCTCSRLMFSGSNYKNYGIGIPPTLPFLDEDLDLLFLCDFDTIVFYFIINFSLAITYFARVFYFMNCSLRVCRGGSYLL